MLQTVLAVSVVLVAASINIVHGEGCSDTTGNKGSVISMCEAGSWTLGDVYIAVTNATMGSSTRCSCTVSAATQGQSTTTNFVLMEKNATVPGCRQTTLTIQWPGASQSLDCTSTLYNIPTYDSTEDVRIVLSRPLLQVSAGLCLYVFPQRRVAGNLILTCQSDEPPSTSTSPSTTSTMSSPATRLTSSAMLTVSASPRPPTTATSDAVWASSADIMMTSEGGVTLSSKPTSSQRQSDTALVAVVVVAVVGWLLAVGLAIGHLVLFLRRKPKSTSARPELENSAYTSLSDVTRVNPRADPNYSDLHAHRGSAQPDSSDVQGARGVYETVEGNRDVPS